MRVLSRRTTHDCALSRTATRECDVKPRHPLARASLEPRYESTSFVVKRHTASAPNTAM